MKLFFSLLTLFICAAVNAQDIAFVVYHAKGAGYKNGAPKTVLKKGDQLLESDVINLSENGSMVLVCRNYKTLKLSKKGSFQVKKLLEQCQNASTNFTTSYFRYVWDELTHPHGSPEKEPGKYMKNTGAVSRGCPFVQIGLPVDTIIITASGKLPIPLKATYPNPYFSIYNDAMDGHLLVNEKLEKDLLKLETSTAKLEEGTYYWQITDGRGSGCERKVLQVWKPKEYKTAVTLIIQSVVSTSPAETAFMKAFLLEEQHFLQEAFTFYQQALKLAPKQPLYKKMVARFYEK